jgi:hypothetical protein
MALTPVGLVYVADPEVRTVRVRVPPAAPFTQASRAAKFAFTWAALAFAPLTKVLGTEQLCAEAPLTKSAKNKKAATMLRIISKSPMTFQLKIEQNNFIRLRLQRQRVV